MANRLLAGNHATHGQGLYVSKSGVDVTAADNDYFLFDSTAAGVGQALFWKEVTLTSSATSTTITYNNFGVRCYAIGTMSWCAGAQTATNITCITDPTNNSTARPAARWSPFGGNIPSTAQTNGETIGFKINNVDNGNGTGTCTVSRLDPESEGKDICVQVLGFKEPV